MCVYLQGPSDGQGVSRTQGPSPSTGQYPRWVVSDGAHYLILCVQASVYVSTRRKTRARNNKRVVRVMRARREVNSKGSIDSLLHWRKVLTHTQYISLLILLLRKGGREDGWVRERFWSCRRLRSWKSAGLLLFLHWCVYVHFYVSVCVHEILHLVLNSNSTPSVKLLQSHCINLFDFEAAARSKRTARCRLVCPGPLLIRVCVCVRVCALTVYFKNQNGRLFFFF